ncbi:uncharacterized protein LOC128269987 [Anopheles cruzii]|uniref:uncharacterized protein LOC128269987 n=1 Tax=Anopheles cruzii TaxID=68878 RepID=UPI0022EC8596|nr:uncharacterized protein LOC128269987 [Anopheles cruzii]
MDEYLQSSSVSDLKVFLEDFLLKVLAIKDTVSEEETRRNVLSNELNVVLAKLRDAALREEDLNAKQIIFGQQNAHSVENDSENVSLVESRKPSTKTPLLTELQRILGITIVCVADCKEFEIHFKDERGTRASFAYNNTGIELTDLHPPLDNIETIRSHFRETNDLIGFLTVLRKKHVVTNNMSTAPM